MLASTLLSLVSKYRRFRTWWLSDFCTDFRRYNCFVLNAVSSSLSLAATNRSSCRLTVLYYMLAAATGRTLAGHLCLSM